MRKLQVWSTNIDSSGERAMGKVHEQPSGQQGEGRDKKDNTKYLVEG